MLPVDSVQVAAAEVDIAVPSRPGRLAGVSMAGFRGRADGFVDLQMVPHPALTVFIDLGDALLVDDGGECQRGSVVVGLAPGTTRVGGSGRDVDCLQLRLSPVVAHAVLAGSSEFGIVALEDFLGRDAMRIQENLHAAKSWEDRFVIAEDALIRRRETNRSVDPEVAFVWRRMASSRGRVRVEQLATEVGWSRTRLWSRFRTQIGITPKRAAQLVRFDHAAHRLAAGHNAALVAADSGYVDQSHLCRDVMAFTGITPTAVANAPWLTVDEVAWPSQHDPLRR